MNIRQVIEKAQGHGLTMLQENGLSENLLNRPLYFLSDPQSNDFLEIASGGKIDNYDGDPPTDENNEKLPKDAIILFPN